MASASTPLKQPIEPERPRDAIDDMTPEEFEVFRRETQEACDEADRDPNSTVSAEEMIAMLEKQHFELTGQRIHLRP